MKFILLSYDKTHGAIELISSPDYSVIEGLVNGLLAGGLVMGENFDILFENAISKEKHNINHLFQYNLTNAEIAQKIISLFG